MRTIILPTIALRSMTVLPNMVIHFDISRKKSIQAVERAMGGKQRLFLVTQLSPEAAEPKAEDLYGIGTVAKVKQIIKMPNGVLRILVEGLEKAHLCSLSEKEGCLMADVAVEKKRLTCPDSNLSKAVVMSLRELIRQYAYINNRMNMDVVNQWLVVENAVELMEKVIIDYPMHYKERQHFLEIMDFDTMYEELAKLIVSDINVGRIKEDLAKKVKDKVDKHQKEYILREQLRVLQEELGGDESPSEVDTFSKAVDALEAKEEIKESIRKEIRRYKLLSQGSSEAAVERGYIEMLLGMPWDKEGEDSRDLTRCEAILERDHYGMKKVKERILESLAVRNIVQSADSPILCLVGPPGTGKTSIAKSVAQALNKEYVRICLGGVKDEAEIRGHRKTYVGAMPGRIVAGLKKAGVKNPLMLLDEIDKMSNDYRSDTASAMLEVLDGEQNANFVDHYIELPTDLSKVLFIATANDLSKVSRPLLDRMEIIEVNSYTQNEKMHIAKGYLIPKQMQKNGLTKRYLKFTDKAIETMIEGYTKEAGVRELERKIAAVCRKVVKELYDNGELKKDGKPVTVNQKNLAVYLGKIKYPSEPAAKKNDIGIVRGLAWTSVGGDTLEIEVNTMPGKADFMLTGKMGEVMQESAKIALTYVRSVVCKKKYRVEKDFFDNNTIHLHIPEGAVPKDGPSAGVTMATAIFSAVTGIPVKASVAMTGEITLRGRVLRIGGLKEKLLAAKAAGIQTVLVPEGNRSDVLELEEEITDGLRIVYVKEMKEVLEEALYDHSKSES